jgi:hypothetical protein
MRECRLLGLYPVAWRERYGAELLELLIARPPDLRDRLDIVRGAVDARLHPQLASSRAVDLPPLPTDLISGLLAVGGGLLLTVWSGLISLYARPWGAGTSELGALEDAVWACSLLGAFGVIGAIVSILARHPDRIGNVAIFGGAAVALGGLFSTNGLVAGPLIVFGTIALARGLAGTIVAPWRAAFLLVATLFFFAAMAYFSAGSGQDLRALWFAVPYGLAWMTVGAGLMLGPGPRRWIGARASAG